MVIELIKTRGIKHTSLKLTDMKNIIFVGLLAFIAVTSFTACDDDPIVSPDVVELTAEEEAGLLLMREEEKLARDVYLYLFDEYGNDIFKNISNAEQTHMDKVLDVLNQYGFEDNASTERGVFNNPDLQALYDALIIQGDISLVDALTVGATIEDVDIYDLDRLSLETTNADILEIYEALNCGSRNHMRGFIKNLDNNSASYAPQFISQADFDAIIASENEHCGQ